jgi:hypothetical protein
MLLRLGESQRVYGAMVVVMAWWWWWWEQSQSFDPYMAMVFWSFNLCWLSNCKTEYSIKTHVNFLFEWWTSDVVHLVD